MSTLVKKRNVIPFVNPYTFLSLVFLGGALNYFCYQSWNSSTSINKLYLLMTIQLIPFIICFSRQHFDYLAFVMFNHFFTYSIGKINQLKFGMGVDELYPIASKTIDELIICSILLCLAYYVSRQLFFFRFIEKEKFQFLTMNRFQLGLVSIYVICVPLFLRSIPNWLIALHFATMAADMVLLLCSRSPGHELLAFFLRSGVAFSTVWYFLSTGFLTMVGNLAGYVFIAACLQRKYKQLILPMILGIIACLVQNVKTEYRSGIAANSEMPVAERLDFLGTLLYAKYIEDISLSSEDSTEDEEGQFTNNISKGFSRAGDDSLEVVLEKTPKEIPFWNGASYEALPFIFIPRFLWSDKPSRHIWNKFGRTYGIISAEDYQTSVAVSYLAEGYMNFGYFGMYSVALLMGLIVALVERLSFYFLKGYYYFTFMCFLMPVMSFASDLTSIINSVFVISAVLVLFRTQFVKMARTDDYC